MSDVRLGRKELRKQRAALDKQSYPGSNAVFLRNNMGRTDANTLLDSVIAYNGKLTDLIEDWHAFSYSGGIAEAEFGTRLFQPSLRDLRFLPASLLDAKEELLPIELIPQNQIALRTFLERLMMLNGRENNLDLLVAGWPSKKSPMLAFDEHVVQLDGLRREGSPFYNGLVAGRFEAVIGHLRSATIRNDVAFRRLRNLLIVQSLIWCAHDVQMLVARIDKSPDFGSLAASKTKRPSPEGTLNQLRDRHVALEAVLDLFYGSGDWRIRDIEPAAVHIETDVVTKHVNPLIRKTAKLALKRLKGRNKCHISSTFIVDLMRQIVAHLRDPDPFLIRTASGRTANVEAKSFAAEWYSVASPLVAAGVAIRRLMQAEQQLPAIIDEMISAGSYIGPVINGSLPAYDDLALPHGAATRLDDLLAFYREALFDGASIETSTSSRPWKATSDAKDFLMARGQRLPCDHEGAAGDPRRSFYLLDVIPEYRFAK